MFRNYDFVAAVYPALERAAFGRALERARNAFIERITRQDRLLLVGEGNGRFAAECLRRKIGGSITVVDSSAKMLRSLRARIGRIAPRTSIELIEADFLRWAADGNRFDGIVTHFFLDLFRPDRQRQVIERIAALSARDAIWVDVDFEPGGGSFVHRSIDWMQYRFDHLVNGVEADRHYDPRKLIRDAGWQCLESRRFSGGSVVAELRARRVG